jgi:hypothetical protein
MSCDRQLSGNLTFEGCVEIQTLLSSLGKSPDRLHHLTDFPAVYVVSATTGRAATLLLVAPSIEVVDCQLFN